MAARARARERPYKVVAGMGAGAGAALAMILAMAAMRFFLGFLTIPELMLNSILKLLGGQAFSDALDTLRYAGRPILFVVILEGALLLGGALGLLYAWLARPNPLTGKRIALFNSPLAGALYGLLIGALLNMAFLPLIGQPVFTDKPYGLYSTSVIPLWLGMMTLALVFGLTLYWLLPRALPLAPAAPPPGMLVPVEVASADRRDFLRVLGGVLLALIGGAALASAGTVINQGGLESPVDKKDAVDAGDANAGYTSASSADATALPDDIAQADVTPAPDLSRPTATQEPPHPTSTQQPQPTSTQPAATMTEPTPTGAAVVEATPSATPGAVAQAPAPSATPQPSVPPTNPPLTQPPPTPTNPPPTSTAVASTSTPAPAIPVIRVSDITPTGSFYHVSKNFFDPSPTLEGWRLDINGMVSNPYTLTYNQLVALPAVEVVVGMMCISNPIGGGLIGNTRWKGVRLADLLKKARPQKGVVDVMLSAVDGYTDSIPLQKALDPNVALVWEMNGAPLPSSHGFPARLLVPGIYGMKHVKWLTSIELVSYDFKGFWQQPDQGWSDPAPVNTMSRIDFPAEGRLTAGKQTLQGIAFAGDRSISKVEISADGGATWNVAYIKPKLSDTSWVVWGYEWMPPAPGKYVVQVRATDGKGNLQTSRARDPYPDGATGWHTVVYTAR